jgi:cation diffusion facilitator family transporter
MGTGQCVAIAGMAVSGALAIIKILAGLAGHSTSVLSDGLESAGDVFASGFVLLGLTVAAKPADADHPYGHGRAETLTGLLIGLVLTAGGALISFASLQHLGENRAAPASFVVWPLLVSLVAKSGLATFKFRYGGRLRSSALVADAWNDTMDCLSATVALLGVGLALWHPGSLLDADRYGGFVVGLIVVATGLRVSRDTALQLMDTMPNESLLSQIRDTATTVPGVKGVEKCFARKTGLRYHVDLHLEVDPEMTVRQSHEIARAVRLRLRERLSWVADVLVHVEPAGLDKLDNKKNGGRSEEDTRR